MSLINFFCQAAHFGHVDAVKLLLKNNATADFANGKGYNYIIIQLLLFITKKSEQFFYDYYYNNKEPLH